MDGLSRAAGGNLPVEVKEGPAKGTWLLSPLTVDDWATVEQHLLEGRPSPVQAVMPDVRALREQGLNEEADRLFKMAYRDTQKWARKQKVAPDEVAEYVDTLDGTRFMIWLALRKNHPDVTRETADELVRAVNEEEMRKKLAKVSATDAAGNSTGPGPESPGQNPAPGNGARRAPVTTPSASTGG
jgi:DNA-binding transcriptional ArsR family regulator